MGKGIEREDLRVLDVRHTHFTVFLHETFDDLAGLSFVFGKIVALLHPIDTLTTSERLLVECHMTNDVEVVAICQGRILLTHGIKQHIVFSQLVDDGLFLVGMAPSATEGIERGILFLDGLAGEVGEFLREERLSVFTEVLHHLVNDFHLPAVNKILLVTL